MIACAKFLWRKVRMKLIQLSLSKILRKEIYLFTIYFKILVCNFVEIPITIRLQHREKLFPQKISRPLSASFWCIFIFSRQFSLVVAWLWCWVVRWWCICSLHSEQKQCVRWIPLTTLLTRMEFGIVKMWPVCCYSCIVIIHSGIVTHMWYSYVI